MVTEIWIVKAERDHCVLKNLNWTYFLGGVGLNPCIFVYWRENKSLLALINLWIS